MADSGSPANRRPNRNENSAESPDYISFMITPSPSRNSRGNWNRNDFRRGRNLLSRYRQSFPFSRYSREGEEPSFILSQEQDRIPYYLHKQRGDDNDDVNKFYNPSMLENPWVELEEKLKQEKMREKNEEKANLERKNKSTSSSHLRESSDSSDDSDDSCDS